MNQAKIEALYSKSNIRTVLHETIKSKLDSMFKNWALEAFLKIPYWLEQEYYDSKNKRLKLLQEKIDKHSLEELVIDIAAAVIHTHQVQTIQQCVGYLSNYMPYEDPFDQAKTAAELLAILSKEGGFYHIQRNGSYNPATIIVNHWPYIDKNLMETFDWINQSHFNPPLIEKPKEVTNNNNCGYHTINEPVICGSHTMHKGTQNLKVINMLNKIEWVLDKNVLNEPELPSKPIENRQQHENFMQMTQESQFVYKLLQRNKPFWFCWQYDSRGRIYSHGYHVNFQASEYKKACLSFNKLEKLT